MACCFFDKWAGIVNNFSPFKPPPFGRGQGAGTQLSICGIVALVELVTRPPTPSQREGGLKQGAGAQLSPDSVLWL